MVNILIIAKEALILSALYALVAVGFTLIFGVGGVLNLSHGASLTIGAFAGHYAAQVYGLGVPGAILASIFVPGLFGALLYLGPIRRVQDEPIIVMIMTLVTAVAIESLFLVVEGAGAQTTLQLIQGRTPAIGGVAIGYNQLLMFIVSWVLLGLLFLYVNETDTGRAILATSQDRKGAFLVGIDSSRINLWMWILAGMLAGIAGLFLASYGLGVAPTMGRQPLVLSFSIVVLGGLGSIRGSVIGAYIIGTLEVLTTSLVDPRLQGLAPLIVLIAVLLVKPSGLFGREVRA
ncbi:MAG: branched-chain amino acid ABC transporter permease [Halorientalis sp.]